MIAFNQPLVPRQANRKYSYKAHLCLTQFFYVFSGWRYKTPEWSWKSSPPRSPRPSSCSFKASATPSFSSERRIRIRPGRNRWQQFRLSRQNRLRRRSRRNLSKEFKILRSDSVKTTSAQKWKAIWPRNSFYQSKFVMSHDLSMKLLRLETSFKVLIEEKFGHRWHISWFIFVIFVRI